MVRRIDADSFAHLMRLSPGMRRDLLDYAGQTPVAAADLKALARIARDDAGKDTPPDPSRRETPGD